MKNTNKIILLVYLYNLDRMQDLQQILCNNLDIDIYLTVGKHNQNQSHLITFLNLFKDRIMYFDYHDNYGVDIAPFIKQLCSIDCNQYPYFLKLHSKNSFLGKSKYIDWGTILWDSLIGNRSIYQHNLQILSQNHVGAITHPSFIFNNKEINNSHKISILCDSLSLPYDKLKNGRFMAGSMFFGKTTIFQQIFKPYNQYLDILFSTESGKVDDQEHINGTFCHATERLMGYILKHQNYNIVPSSLYPIITIYNPQHKKFHLHITYNNIVYLYEDINIYGHIIESNNKYIIINWKHLNDQTVKYNFISPRLMIRAL